MSYLTVKYSIYVCRKFSNVLHHSDLHKYKFITNKTLDILGVFSQPFQALLFEFASFFKKSKSEARLDKLDLQL